MAMTIAEFITARLDEDEAGARAANSSRERWTLSEQSGLSVKTGWDGCIEIADGWRAEAAHIARHDPPRVLAEVAAKRAILGEHSVTTAVWWADDEQYDVNACDTCAVGNYGVEYPCLTVRYLALPYADHPDYRAEWMPAS